MTATGPAIMEVDLGSVAGTAVVRFLDEPLARGLNGETAVDRFLDEPAVAAKQQAIPLLIDLMSARGSAKKNKAVGSDRCPSEFWKYLSCVSMVVIFRFFLMRLLAMEDGRNVDSPH